jgi:hypothetical protein
MPQELFVYYKAEVAHEAAVVTAASRMQSALRLEHGSLRARLLRRPMADASHQHTWMEIYSIDGAHQYDGIDGACVALIEQHAQAWSELRSGPRHLEVFDACA